MTRRQQWTAIQAANAGLLFLNLLALVREGLPSMFQVISSNSTLIGATIAVSGVIWQTKVGFRNIVRAQNHRGELERKAELEKYEREILRQANEREREKKVLAAALRGELSSMFDHFGHTARMLASMHIVYKNMMERGETREQDFPKVQPFREIIISENTKSLGLLGASLVADLSTVYRQGEVVVSNNEPKLDIAVLVPLLDVWSKAMMRYIEDIHHVRMRLLALEYGGEDPGSLVDKKIAAFEAQRSSTAAP